MWRLVLDIVYGIFMVFEVLGMLFTIAIVVSPTWEAIAKRMKARKYRRSLVSEAVPKPTRRAE